MDFAFNTGPYDHGGTAVTSTPGSDNLGKTTIVTVGGENTPLTVVAIVDIALEVSETDETKHSASYWREYGAALKRNAAIKFTFQHDKDDLIQIRLMDLKESGNPEFFRVWFPGTQKTWISFDGIITNVRYDAPIGDLVQGTFAVVPIANMEKY